MRDSSAELLKKASICDRVTKADVSIYLKGFVKNNCKFNERPSENDKKKVALIYHNYNKGTGRHNERARLHIGTCVRI